MDLINRSKTGYPAYYRAILVGGHAITEPQAGSDVNAIETHAIKNDSGFILNGHKRFITNTPIADVLLIYAKLEGKLSAFLIKQEDVGANFSDQPSVTGCASATMGRCHPARLLYSFRPPIR